MRGARTRSRSRPGWGCAWGGVLSVLLAAAPTGAQQLQPPPPPADSGAQVEVVPGARYEAGALRRFLVGDNRRELWVRELRVPLLDLDAFGGGLVPEDQGGNQSKTLHMVTPEGRTYIFRSVNKFMGQVFPDDLNGTLVEEMAQDHVSVFHPGGSFVVPRLHEELGQLAIPPVYRVMPDDPRLGEYRETFAGMLGTMVERPNEGEHGEALFAGSHKIVGTDEVLDKLEDHPRNRVPAREFLAARLVDFLVGDTDRGPDQWRWARTPVDDGFVWRPIVRDRDWAFMTADGAIPWMLRKFYPKLVRFEDDLPGVEALTWADVGMGRRLLAELDAAAWDSVVTRVETSLTDAVIDAAVDRLPPEQKPDHAEALAARLKERRSGLRSAAEAWYARLATDVDVEATDLPDRAEIERREDGTVVVTLLAPARELVPVEEGDDDDTPDAEEYAADPYYDADFEGVSDPDEVDAWAPVYRRVFRPDATKEVRVYLHGGDDMAVVRGAGPAGITVRVIGGGGEDALYDEAAGAGRTTFHDDDEDTRFVPGPHTVIDTRDFEAPEGSENFLLHKMGYDRHRDWGAERSLFSPALDYREGAGLILGGGPSWTDYEFRSLPFGTRLSVEGLVSTRTGGLGVDAVAEGHVASSPAYVRLHGRATQFEAIRFYGYGNDSPDIGQDASLIMQDQALLEAAVGASGNDWRVEGGPVLRYTDADVPAGNPAAAAGYPGTGTMLELGAAARAGLSRVDDDGLPTRGVRFDVAARGFPLAGDGAGPHAGADAELRGYVPLPVADAVVGLRVGGRRAWGDFPIHAAATIGGLSTLRGYRWQRFAGDAAAYGGANLRLPLFRANLLLARGLVGAIGLADAGAVWLDGDGGDWHTSYGAGLTFETLGTGIYGLWARGDEDRFYVGLGVPF